MKVYEFFDEDYDKVVDMAEEIKELAIKLTSCLNKAEERDEKVGETNFRRNAPRMRRGRGGSQSYAMYPHMRGGSSRLTDVPPHMRGGYMVSPEEEEWVANERYNW